MRTANFSQMNENSVLHCVRMKRKLMLCLTTLWRMYPENIVRDERLPWCIAYHIPLQYAFACLPFQQHLKEIARFIRVLSNLSLCFTMTPYRATVAKILITPHQQTVIWYLFYTSVQCPLTFITDPQVRSPTYTVECSYNKIMLKALKEYQIFIQFRIHAFLWAIYSMRSTNLGILHGTLTFVIDCPI